MHGPHTFPKSERLQHGWQFRRVYDNGRRCAGRLLVVCALPTTEGGRQVGVVASRRVGNAVARNRARRLLREAYRQNKNNLQENLQLVMIARSAIREKKLAEVESEVIALWKRTRIVRET